MFMVLEPIKTPLKDIGLARDENGKLWIRHSHFGVSLGYNKYLSLSDKSSTYICKCIKEFKAVRNIDGQNWLDLNLVVERVLPKFINNYLEYLRYRQSRYKSGANGHLTDAKTVSIILKERLSMYYSNKNIVNWRKGELGELIVADFSKKNGNHIRKPYPDYSSGATVFDFILTDINGNDILLEVKTQKAMLFGATQTPTYSFPCAVIDKYLTYAEAREVPAALAVVDPEAKKIFVGDLNKLNTQSYCDGYSFPLERDNETLDTDFRYFNQKQFNQVADIPPCKELSELRNLFGLPDESEPASVIVDSPKSKADEQPVEQFDSDVDPFEDHAEIEHVEDVQEAPPVDNTPPSDTTLTEDEQQKLSFAIAAEMDLQKYLLLVEEYICDFNTYMQGSPRVKETLNRNTKIGKLYDVFCEMHSCCIDIKNFFSEYKKNKRRLSDVQKS